jgi:hypothetical protein
MAAIFGWFNRARDLRLVFEAGKTIRVERKFAGEDFERDVAIEARRTRYTSPIPPAPMAD